MKKNPPTSLKIGSTTTFHLKRKKEVLRESTKQNPIKKKRNKEKKANIIIIKFKFGIYLTNGLCFLINKILFHKWNPKTKTIFLNVTTSMWSGKKDIVKEGNLYFVSVCK